VHVYIRETAQLVGFFVQKLLFNSFHALTFADRVGQMQSNGISKTPDIL
jgi:hypothetical protein